MARTREQDRLYRREYRARKRAERLHVEALAPAKVRLLPKVLPGVRAELNALPPDLRTSRPGMVAIAQTLAAAIDCEPATVDLVRLVTRLSKVLAGLHESARSAEIVRTRSGPKDELTRQREAGARRRARIVG